MSVTLSRKAARDMKQHPLRTLLTVITVAVAVAAVWMLAVPRTLDAAMDNRREIDVAHHIVLSPQNLWFSGEGSEQPPAVAEISPAELAGVAELPNVAAIDSRPIWKTSARINGEQEDVWLVGVNDFTAQSVNIVDVETGAAPTDGELETLVDSFSVRAGRLNLAAGAAVDIRAGDARFYPFTVTGVGGTVGLNPRADDETPVFYVSSDVVHLFLAHSGFNSIEIRVEDPAAVDTTVQEVRAYLDRVAPDAEYWRLAEIVRPETWPGREKLDRLLPLLYVLAAVATGSALVLVATTMNTLIRGQSRQIGILKAIGASRAEIRACYLRAALLLGGSGAALGTMFGSTAVWAFGRYAQEQLLGITPVWRIDFTVALLATCVGVAATTLAATPAIRRAMNIPVLAALDDHGSSNGSGRSTLDVFAARAPFRRQTTRIGVRNVARRTSRSLAAVAQVALGVGAALAFGGFAVTGVAVSSDTLTREGSDITVYGEMGLLDPGAAAAIQSLEGVAAVQPTVDARVEYEKGQLTVRGFPLDPVYEPALISGRWFTTTELDEARAVAIVGAPLAEAIGTDVGRILEISTDSAVIQVEIIGIDDSLVQDGKYLWMPLTTVLEFEGLPAPPVYWIETTSSEPEDVDRVAAGIVSLLEQPGRPVIAHARYADLAAARREDKLVGGVIQVLALPILAVGMIGLVSTMTSNVLDRTREIGVLRSLGSRSRHLRRIFRAEGTTLSVAGWLVGLPIGYGLARLIVWLFGRALHATLDLQFPIWLMFTALLGVVIVTRIALRPPLRHATRMQPGMAIRYE